LNIFDQPIPLSTIDDMPAACFESVWYSTGASRRIKT